MTLNAADSRIGLPQEPYSVQLVNEWIRVQRLLHNEWSQAKGVNTRLGKQQKPQLDLLDIMVTPKYHAPVMRSMRTACGESHRCPSLHPDPALVLPAEFIITIGDILDFLQPAFFVISLGTPGTIHYALNYTKRELMRVCYGSKRIEGTIVEGIPSQIGDKNTKWKPGGAFWQLQPVCGDEREGTLRGAAACIQTRNRILLAECDIDDPVIQADSDIIGDNIPLLCAAVVDTGNRGPHRYFVIPTAEKERLKVFFNGVWEMLGFDPSGFDNPKLSRLANMGRGKGRGGQPWMQTLLWLSKTPTRLIPDSKFQTMDEFMAAFHEAVLANADSIFKEIEQMKEAIAKLEERIAEGRQRLGVERKQKPGTKAKGNKSKPATERNSGKLQDMQDIGGDALTDCRRILREHLKTAGDKLVLPAELKMSVIDELSKRYTFDEDTDANRREIERILEKVCSTPHRPIGSGRRHKHRPSQNIPDEDFYKTLNFHYTAAFWATERCRAWKQKTEKCYVEFAFVALLLHQACGICRTDILRWLKEFFNT